MGFNAMYQLNYYRNRNGSSSCKTVTCDNCSTWIGILFAIYKYLTDHSISSLEVVFMKDRSWDSYQNRKLLFHLDRR